MRVLMLQLSLSIILLPCHAGFFQNELNNEFSALLDKAEQNSDSAFLYLKRAESLSKVPVEQMALNRAWANYFWEIEQFDSLRDRLNQNAVLSLDNEKKEIQIEQGKTYLIEELYLRGTGKHSEAFDILFRTKRILEKWEPESSFLTDCYRTIGVNYWLTKDFNQAEKWWKTSLKHAVENSHLSLQSLLNYSLGLVYARQHQLSLAKEHYQYASVMMLQEDVGSTWRRSILIHNAIGGIFLEIQKADSARISFEKGLKVLEGHKDAGGIYYYYKSILYKNLARVSRRLNYYRLESR